MARTSDEELVYLTTQEIISIHDEMISEDPDAEPGVLTDTGDIEFIIEKVRHGHFGVKPEGIHEKAVELMRLLASNHIFVDGNKRTALNSTATFYLLNGYSFNYGEEIKAILKMFAVMERMVDKKELVRYMDDITSEIDPEDVDDYGVDI